jgi:hypothetical protein
MKKYLIIFWLVLASQLNAQKTTKAGFYVLPEELSTYAKFSELEKYYSGSKPLSSLTFSTKIPWYIYSDRNNNRTKESPNSQISFRQLDFMQPLLVKEIEGSWLHVYIPYEFKNGRSNDRPVDVGWIKADKTVLSGYPVLTDQGATKKAMALISFEEGVLNENQRDKISVKYNFWWDPARREKKKESTKFKIYYILKERSGMKLLSTTDNLRTNKIELQTNVDGWMSNSHITGWNNRLCLEPNFGSDIVQQYQDKTADIYATERLLSSWTQSGYVNTDGRVKSYQLQRTMIEPEIMRLPILSTPKDNFERTTKVATVGNLAGESISDDEKAFWLKELKKLEEQQRNINVVFVVDATASMAPYYKSVAQSIQRIVDQNLASGFDSKLKFGAVIYRDYADGEEAYDYYRLTSNEEALEKWLLEVKCQSKDADLPEAQYNGIIEGLKKVGLQKGQSNIMVLIGDAGNHDESKDKMKRTLDQAVTTMAEYQMNMISFQVKFNRQYDTYIKFNDDAMEYLYALSNSVKADNSIKTELSESDEYKNTYNISFKAPDGTDISGLYTFGSFTHAPDKTQMEGSFLEENIRNATQSYLTRINERIQILKRKLDGEVIKDETGTDAYDEGASKVLCSYCKDDVEKYKGCLRFLSTIGDFSYVGYTNINMYDDEPVYEPVVFLSRKEFNIIQKSFQDMQDLGSFSQMKENLYKALVTQAEVITGDPSELVAEKTLNEIWEILLNVPFDYNNSYGDLKYKKLKDIRSLNSSDFKRFLSDFIDKSSSFSPNAYRNRQFSLGGNTFYWVPLKDFPGNE